jgi:hypothetical protein
MPFTTGDSVRVKDGVMCPDDDSLCVGGWQGRIFDIDEDLVGVRWDSITLKQMPVDYIQFSEEEGLDWTMMYLSVDEVEPAEPRDSTDVADEVREALESLFSWLGDGEERERIFNVIANADDPLEGWTIYLTSQLTFPFDAVVNEPQDQGPLVHGDDVTVHGIFETDDLCGVLVQVTHKGQRYLFPLCDPTVRDKKSSNYLPLHDYCVWFANH